MYFLKFIFMLAILLLVKSMNLFMPFDSFSWWQQTPVYLLSTFLVSWIFKLFGMPIDRLFADDDDKKKHHRRHWRK
ncbi:hypothetical protein LFAB_11480 [Lactiplantibacillus fabifermentans T30PCM01]|uniref:Uncharacterized protein n=1 Tax=Lactiplantibacillus fabifermentans T30PCM01 TaxID=1400520 RepID=W6T6E5_9LACO|nr:hypothetical protein [Lactiplantibacillus fabifermentans]ETY73604.1 hypothetical protein LFAB_11480 [Lactiplantibacillus fabifermentans T30PCM01]